MILNYLKIAWRSIKKNKFFSLLNIFGLSISLGIALLLIGYALYELSYDKFFPKGEHIYRVTMQTTPEYDKEIWVDLPNSVGPAIKEEVPGVVNFTRLVKNDFGTPSSILVGEKTFVEKNVYLADSSLFSIFDFQFIDGDKNTVFKDVNSIAISKSRKELLFGDASAIDQLIILNQRDTLKVSAVYEDLPKNSSLDCQMVFNIMDSWMGKNVYWSNASYETYIQVQETADPQTISELSTALINKHVEKSNQYFTDFYLQPLHKVHLYSKSFREGNSPRNGDIDRVKNLLYLAGLVLLIACINYMNLATAKTTLYAKEVGVNKVLGASKKQLRTRFLMETMLLSGISISIGFILCLVGIPLFNNITGAELSYQHFLTVEILLILLACLMITTLFAGSFPAFYLSSISSLNLMGKGKSRNAALVEPARKGLVVFQFASSIILIISVIIMIQQMKYIADRNIGFNPEKLLATNTISIKTTKSYESLVNGLNQIPGTTAITGTQAIPGLGESGKNIHKLGNSDPAGLPVFTNVTNGPVVKTLGLKLLAGRDLPGSLSLGDTVNYVLINEVALAYLGYQKPEDAIGQLLNTESAGKSIIEGVVANFNFKSLKENIGGYYFNRMNVPSEGIRYLMIRFETEHTQEYLAQVEQVFKTHIPESAFDYTFVDNHVAQQYMAEKRSNHILISFSILTIGIACLGLLGLAAFTAEQRSKEIGIRKVLGASVFNISNLLTGGYFKLILIAFVIASPIAWYFMNHWLNDFAYRIEIPWWAFVIAAGITLLITALTIGFQTLKAAIANPVDSLRDE